LPFALYSDLYDFDDFVRGLTNSGFCGLLWCPELRDASSIDDLVRRVQLVTLSPVSQIDGWYIRNPPWHHMNAAANNAGERMPESERATALVREALRFRMRILPYLYTAFGRYHEDGTPPVRAMVMEEPANRALWECHDQLMIGPDLLAAPVRPGQTSRNVYLPGSSWIDFHTGEVLQGGKQYTVDAPLDRIPLFVRDGAILPLADTEHEDGIERADSLRVAATVFTTGDSARGTVLEPPEDPDQPILPRELVWSRQEGGVCHGPEVLGKRFSISRWQVVKSRGSSSSE
jgi:alpha-D-xyloside xylohydrolase